MIVLKDENTDKSLLIAQNNVPAMKDYICDLKKMIKTINKEIKCIEKYIERIDH